MQSAAFYKSTIQLMVVYNYFYLIGSGEILEYLAHVDAEANEMGTADAEYRKQSERNR